MKLKASPSFMIGFLFRSHVKFLLTVYVVAAVMIGLSDTLVMAVIISPWNLVPFTAGLLAHVLLKKIDLMKAWLKAFSLEGRDPTTGVPC